MTQRFEIPKTPEISALIRKYDRYTEDYALGEQEACLFAVLPSLSEWERVVLFAYSEHRSVRKFARFFGVTNWAAQQTIGELKEKVKRLYRKQLI